MQKTPTISCVARLGLNPSEGPLVEAVPPAWFAGPEDELREQRIWERRHTRRSAVPPSIYTVYDGDCDGKVEQVVHGMSRWWWGR